MWELAHKICGNKHLLNSKFSFQFLSAALKHIYSLYMMSVILHVWCFMGGTRFTETHLMSDNLIKKNAFSDDLFLLGRVEMTNLSMYRRGLSETCLVSHPPCLLCFDRLSAVL